MQENKLSTELIGKGRHEPGPNSDEIKSTCCYIVDFDVTFL